MNEPLQLLCLTDAAPDLATSVYGPIVVQGCSDLAQLGGQLQQQRFDALLVRLADEAEEAAFRHWSALSSAVLDMAVLLAVREPAGAQVTQWLQLGVQDVLPLREAGAERLALAVRQAVERKRLEQAARRAHATDLATGLPNHAQLMEHMTHLLALREREPASMALLVLRIEGLATAEARLGAESTNVLRRKIAVRLRAGLRASDVVSALGPDRFGVLLAWIDDERDSERVAAKLSQLLQRPISVAGQDVAVSVSVGVARYPAQGKDADTLLRLASGEASTREAQGRSGFANRIERGGRAAANDDTGA
ncbi:MAG: GGDEF domain-containing protein [Burkholderiaceae bacterium]